MLPRMFARSLVAFSLVVGLAAVSAAGCAHIDSFTASPVRVCPGETITLAWKATGNVSLGAEPAVSGPGLGDVSSEGTAAVAIQKSTVFTLKATRLFGDAEPQHKEVTVGDGQSPPKPFGGIATCDGTKGAVSVAFKLDDSVLGGHIRPIALANPYDRELQIVHDGVTVKLAGHAQSNQLKDRAAAGDWTLQAPLGAGETCDAALDALASRLVATFTFGC